MLSIQSMVTLAIHTATACRTLTIWYAWLPRWHGSSRSHVTGFVATVASDHEDNSTHHYQGSWIRHSASFGVVLLPQLLIALRMLVSDLVEYTRFSVQNTVSFCFLDTHTPQPQHHKVIALKRMRVPLASPSMLWIWGGLVHSFGRAPVQVPTFLKILLLYSTAMDTLVFSHHPGLLSLLYSSYVLSGLCVNLTQARV